MDVVRAPDIYVNASVALGTPPEHAARRAFAGPARPETSGWVLERIESMLRAIPEFKDDAVEQIVTTNALSGSRPWRHNIHTAKLGS